MDEIFRDLLGAFAQNGVPIAATINKDELKNLIHSFQESPWAQLLKDIQAPHASCGSGKGKEPEKPSPSLAPYDIREMDTYYKVYIDLPGVNKADINLNVSTDMNVLGLSVDRKNIYGNASDKLIYKGRYSGLISMNFTLPKNIDKTSIKAEYSDGVLCVTVKKSVEGVYTQKISIS